MGIDGMNEDKVYMPIDYGQVQADRIRLSQIADALERAERMGQPEDMPEGSRYIGITDTLAKQLTEELRAIAERM